MKRLSAEIIATLESQDGLITRSQLHQAGVASSTLASLLERGHFSWVLPRVAGLAGMPLSWHRRARALLLSLGDESWLSHGTAAYLHGLRGSAPTLPVNATVPYGRSVRIDGSSWACVHRSRVPIDHGEKVIDGLRMTSVERALLDLATSSGVGWSLDTVTDALRRALTTVDALREVAEDRAHVVGRDRLRRVLAHVDPAIARARSKPEWAIREILVEAGLPSPILNHEIVTDGGRVRFEIDLAWPDYLVGFEYDSDQHHSTPRELRRDRVRHRRIQQLGWDLRHLSSSDLRNRGQLVREVRQALELSGWSR